MREEGAMIRNGFVGEGRRVYVFFVDCSSVFKHGSQREENEPDGTRVTGVFGRIRLISKFQKMGR